MVFGFRVTYPFDKVVEASSIRRESGGDDLFDFVVFVFSFDNVGGRTGEIGSMLGCLGVGGEKGVVENWVNSPCRGKFES